MLLNRKSLKDTLSWKNMNVKLPKFDFDEISKNTKTSPKWVHFGAGNIFRGFIANAYQKLLDEKKADTGIIAVESFDFEVIDKVYIPYDNLTLLVLMNSNGDFDKKIISSISEALTTDKNRPNDYKRLIEIFENPSLQMVSFTITEKGYSLTSPSGKFLNIIQQDIKNGPDNCFHTMSIIASLAYKRYLKGQFPMTFVSMDNCSHNGDKLKNGVITIAEKWLENNFVEANFIAYLKDKKKITFPLSMIDKITPRPSDVVKETLTKLSLEKMDTIITSKHSYMAPFVNSEISEYLVIEDDFTNGRPILEDAGVIFTNRDTVNNVETMKVTTCLNPLHTALAVSGCLLGYTLIADEMKDKELKKLIEKIGYDEGMKVVIDPKIINPKEFLDEVINERFANPFIPDTPQRIATDTSQKVGIRFGETIKAYIKREDLNVQDLVAIPLAIALWCRYLLGIDDNGNPFEISPDPLGDTLQSYFSGVKFGDKTSNIHKILSNEEIFSVNLYTIGLGKKIEDMFYKMLAGKNAVRNTLIDFLD